VVFINVSRLRGVLGCRTCLGNPPPPLNLGRYTAKVIMKENIFTILKSEFGKDRIDVIDLKKFIENKNTILRKTS